MPRCRLSTHHRNHRGCPRLAGSFVPAEPLLRVSFAVLVGLAAIAPRTAVALPPTTPDWIVAEGDGYDNFANDVNTAGDVNGDGYSDVIVGGDLYDNGEVDEGELCAGQLS